MSTLNRRFNAFETTLRIRTRHIYELPVQFWKEWLGSGLHFHLGHFPHPDVSLSESVRLAVRHLAALLPYGSATRVLDVGCGWGGPSFVLAELWNAEVFGLTVSQRQARFVNRLATSTGVAVTARVADIERCPLDGFRQFDVCWLFEVLEHIVDRRGALERLHQVRTPCGCLALTTTCRAPALPRAIACSEYLGIAPLDTIAGIQSLVAEAGWQTIRSVDCTELTLPVWDRWIDNLARVKRPDWQDAKNRMIAEFAGLSQMFRSGLLQSLQLVAVAPVAGAPSHDPGA